MLIVLIKQPVCRTFEREKENFIDIFDLSWGFAGHKIRADCEFTRAGAKVGTPGKPGG